MPGGGRRRRSCLHERVRWPTVPVDYDVRIRAVRRGLSARAARALKGLHYQFQKYVARLLPRGIILARGARTFDVLNA